ncbi:hypothetical protein FMEAI12_4660028 [Parafrankia sp. Ea1.12]|nr:hypothetical protein FMEAI12_4660028 [Parafrankia sp. Ea1.12]
MDVFIPGMSARAPNPAGTILPECVGANRLPPAAVVPAWLIPVGPSCKHPSAGFNRPVQEPPAKDSHPHQTREAGGGLWNTGQEPRTARRCSRRRPWMRSRTPRPRWCRRWRASSQQTRRPGSAGSACPGGHTFQARPVRARTHEGAPPESATRGGPCSISPGHRTRRR